MKYFEKIGEFDPQETREQLLARPELWNAHPGRTAPSGPHFGIPDIWVRFRAAKELIFPHHFAEAHFPEFYPAWEALPGLQVVVRELIGQVRPFHLGGILITKIPAGKCVKPHHDRGLWHAEFYNYKVFWVLQGSDLCLNRFEDQSVRMLPGEAYRIDNQVLHSVENPSPIDRITAIICMRTES